MKRLIPYILALAIGSANAGSFETIIGNNATTIDAKSYNKIGEKTDIGKRTALLFRTRLADNYTEGLGGFSIADISFRIGKGFDIIGEARYSGGKHVNPESYLGFDQVLI